MTIAFSGGVGIAAAVSGAISAWYWWKASKVVYRPMPPPVSTLSDMGKATNSGIERYVVDSGAANKVAAIWSGATAFISGIAAFLSGLGV